MIQNTTRMTGKNFQLLTSSLHGTVVKKWKSAEDLQPDTSLILALLSE